MKNLLRVFMVVTVVGLIFVGDITCYAADNNLINTISYGDNITAELYDTDEDGEVDYLKLVGFGKMKDMIIEEYYDPEDDMDYVRGPLSDYDYTIRRIDIDERITSIGNYAFFGCSMVEEIKLPNCINKIGNGSFYSCSRLNEMKIPYGVMSIGEDAFAFCSSLSNIVIPSSVVTISDGAFYFCDALTSVVVPSSVVTMGTGIFTSCSSLGSVSFADGITSIPASTFRWCESLNSVTIPSSVKYIGEDAFLMENNKVKNIYYVGDKDEYCLMNIYDNNIAETNVYYVTNEWSNDYSKCSIKRTSINYDGDDYIENFSTKVLSIVIKEATCSSEGISYNLALYGGYMFYSPEISIPTIAHDWNEGKVETEAMCSKEGLLVKSCKNCGEIEKTILERTNHKYIWKIDKEAAVGVAGSKHEECSVCGHKKVSVEIPALEAEKTNPPTQNEVKDDSQIVDKPTKFNIKNKNTYKKSKKVTIKDPDGIKTVKLNNKKITVKKGKKSITFKISKYKKYLAKKGKWNTLVVTDVNGKKKTIKFKAK